MSTEANKALVRRLIEEVWNKGHLAVADEVVASTLVRNGRVMTPADYKQAAVRLRAAFPDLHELIEDQIAEGDQVVNRETVRGTHQGEFQGIAPTNRQVTFTAIGIFRIEAGKVVEIWSSSDTLGLQRQLGGSSAAQIAG